MTRPHPKPRRLPAPSRRFESTAAAAQDSFTGGLVIFGCSRLIALFAPLDRDPSPFEAALTETGGCAAAIRRRPITGWARRPSDMTCSRKFSGLPRRVPGRSGGAIAVGFISTLFGVISGYFGGLVDDVLMRITDVALSIPTLPFAIVAVGLLGRASQHHPRHHAAVLAQRRPDHPLHRADRAREGLREMGAGGRAPRICTSSSTTSLPNVFRVVLLWITMSVAFAILTEASLSFIGLGDPVGGQLGADAQHRLRQRQPAHGLVVGGAAVVALVMLISALYLIGRGFEEQANPAAAAGDDMDGSAETDCDRQLEAKPPVT
jgi:peptide/nickel transport system permease protein